MTVLVTADEMAAAERSTIERGASGPDLMRRAAAAIADWIESHCAIVGAVTGLVGPGNNGGDTLVALGILGTRGWRSTALLVNRNELGDLPMSDAERAVIEIGGANALGDADVIFDGIYGFRSRPSLPAKVSAVFADARRARASTGARVIAIDVPSGVDVSTGEAAADALPADVTLCLGLPKLGLTRQPAAGYVGELEVIDIGIVAPTIRGRAELLDRRTIAGLLPERQANAHKSSVGAVLIVGGAPTYFGAPRLSAEAALRIGAGLVAAAIPSAIVPVLATQVPEAVVVPCDDDDSFPAIRRFVDERDSMLHAMVIGPGLGRSDHASTILEHLLGRQAPDEIRRRSKVIDADALNWMSDQPEVPAGLTPGSAVLTPHPGEMSRLLGCSVSDVLADPVETARRAASQFGQVIILKTGHSPVTHPHGHVWLAQRTTPELATAGTGDVLSGIVGGLLAQGLSPWDAARAGIFIGAQAGKRAAQMQGTVGVVAHDVIDELGRAYLDVQRPGWQRWRWGEEGSPHVEH